MNKKGIKGIRVISALVCLALALSGCSNVAGIEHLLLESLSQQMVLTGEYSLSANSDSGEDLMSLVSMESFTTVYAYAEEDVNSTWDHESATTITFSDSIAKISGFGANFSNKTLVIEQPGTYVLSGSLTNGQILIYTVTKGLVRLVLNDVSIHCETGPAIFAPRCEKLVLILAEGTQNTVSDGSRYTNTGEDEPNAAIYVQDSLSITGSGRLAVSGNYKHGIRSQDYLVITDGVIQVDSVSDALRGRDGVAIKDGTLILTAGSDGIVSNNDKSDKKGFVIINGGTFTIQANNDGIQSESCLTVTGGSFDIKTGGGSANASVGLSGFGGGFRGAPNQNIQTATTTESMKALKAGKQIYIVGGEFTIDAEDDGIHSNNCILITSGKLSIKTGDDGIHADNVAEITGGEIDIPICYEGIEGTSVTISGGKISVVSSDDGINAATSGGASMGGRSFATNENNVVRISGGDIEILAQGDGIDSNGYIYLEGGTLKISGPSQVMEGAIDYDGFMLVTGGELITAGSVMGASSDSTQPVLLVSYTNQQLSGSVIEIRDAEGNTLLAYTSQTTYSMSGFTSPAFKLGETYSLFIDGQKKTDVILNSTVTSTRDDGGTYSGNGGMGGGPGGGGGMGGGRGGGPGGGMGDGRGGNPGVGMGEAPGSDTDGNPGGNSLLI